MKNKILITLLTAGSLLAAAASQAASTPADLSAQLQQLASKHQVCTAALIYIRNQQIQEPQFAKACADAVMPDANSIFQAASLGKPVFAYAVLGLAAQGKLALDEPLMQYLPQGYQHALRQGDINSPQELVTDPRLQKITARMVLQHMAGLHNWSSGKLEFQSEPGTRWQYSGEGYMLLQAVVESITGMGLEAWMQQQVFTPLGMQHSSYAPPKEWQDLLIAGSIQGKTLPLRPPRKAVAPASLHTSISDYARFVQTVLKDASLQKQILDAPLMANQHGKIEWGLGWALSHTTTAEHAPLLWHWGNNYGYRAFVIVAPVTGDGMILLASGDQGLRLAQAMTTNIIPGQLSLFQFPLLGMKQGLLCQVTGIC
ncbi:MAG: serine hydrolase domain-containing protein [Pseudomonadota bacterium]